MDHLEVATKVLRTEELLLDAALGRDPHFLFATAVRQQLGSPGDRTDANRSGAIAGTDSC